MEHLSIVSDITKSRWKLYLPEEIIYLSWISAIEFAESLRCAQIAYPNDKGLKQMALGELNTTNLFYDDYKTKGDHHEFLAHFVKKSIKVETIRSSVLYAGLDYQKAVYELGGNKERAMTVFSREQQLPNIFKEILQAHDWNRLGFGFYRYYLEKHIELDSTPDGHADLIKNFILDDNVLVRFYFARLKMYQSLVR